MSSFYKEFSRSEYSTKMPVMSPFLLLAGLGLVFSYKNVLLSPTSFISTVENQLFENETISVLEKQNVKKSTVLFDYKNFLSLNYFDLSRFDTLHIKRAYCEEFLFYLAHYYELICISDGPPMISDRELKEIDPLGCISYKIFIKNKKDFGAAHLNRDINSLVVISKCKNEFSKDFDENLLAIPKFNGLQDSSLLDLVHFFTNLYFMDLPDLRTVLGTYRNTSFFPSFKITQERLFNQRNMFSFSNFNQKLKEINLKKVADYKEVKQKFPKPIDYSAIRDTVFRFVKCVMF